MKLAARSTCDTFRRARSHRERESQARREPRLPVSWAALLRAGGSQWSVAALLRVAGLAASVPHANRSGIESDRDRPRILAADDQQRNRSARDQRLAQLRQIKV